MAKITTSSTAEYFAKNLQQVGFSSPLKAVLTTLKEAVDNSLDACEEAEILPELSVMITKVGAGSSRSSDLVEVVVEDNGPGIETEDLTKVFGEYLASSKFGKGQCSRGQQGIGISAATTWAQLTNATGVKVISKTSRMRKAVSATVDVDIKGNKGVLKKKESLDWDRPHGTRVEFRIDGRVQLKGDGGILTYLEGTTLVNPHLSLNYKLVDNDWVNIPRVSEEVPDIPKATLPHPHTMKLGEFMTHAGLYGKINLESFLKKGFSRVTDSTIKDIVKKGLPKSHLSKGLLSINEGDYKRIFQVIQEVDLANPSTRSVLTVGEEGLAKSIQRLGEVDFFSVVTRKPKICDFKPVVVEVAIARFVQRGELDNPVQLLRFANRVPLQFDKGACAITKSVESVNWKSYGLGQPKRSLPLGPYVFAVAITSPFIKFKNASKETVDASDELVDEIRLALMQTGQKLSRHIRREDRAADLERKISHIEKFGPILVRGLAKIVKAPQTRVKKAEEGLKKILGRDADVAEEKLADAETKLKALKKKQKEKFGDGIHNEDEMAAAGNEDGPQAEVEPSRKPKVSSRGKTRSKKTKKKSAAKVLKKPKKASSKKAVFKKAASAKKKAAGAKKASKKKTKKKSKKR